MAFWIVIPHIIRDKMTSIKNPYLKVPYKQFYDYFGYKDEVRIMICLSKHTYEAHSPLFQVYQFISKFTRERESAGYLEYFVALRPNVSFITHNTTTEPHNKARLVIYNPEDIIINYDNLFPISYGKSKNYSHLIE